MELEVYGLKEESEKLSVKNSRISLAGRIREFTAVRLIRDGRLGKALVEGDNVEKAKSLAERLLKFSRREDYTLPNGCKKRWDRTFEVDIEDLTEELSTLIAEAEDKGISVGEGKVILTTRTFSVESSKGADVEGRYSFSAFEFTLVKEGLSLPFVGGSAGRPGLEDVFGRAFEVFKSAKERAKPSSGTHRVILAPYHASLLTLMGLLTHLRGSSVVRNTSRLRNELGRRIAPEKFTLLDWPLMNDSLRYVEADDEGVPVERNVLVDKGILRGFLWDSYWALKAGKRSTGNGLRIEDVVIDAPHNLVLTPGTISFDELLSELGNGYVILGIRGLNTLDPQSGRFSLVATPALVVKNGEITGHTSFAFEGTVEGLLGNIEDLGNELTHVWFEEGFSTAFPYVLTSINIV